jgi:hypothetical protein
MWTKSAVRNTCHEAGIVLESVLETFDMNRVCVFWFHFYGFPQPLAEGLS